MLRENLGILVDRPDQDIEFTVTGLLFPALEFLPSPADKTRVLPQWGNRLPVPKLLFQIVETLLFV